MLSSLSRYFAGSNSGRSCTLMVFFILLPFALEQCGLERNKIARCRKQRKHDKFMPAHPSHKNRNVARVGHPVSCAPGRKYRWTADGKTWLKCNRSITKISSKEPAKTIPQRLKPTVIPRRF